MSVKHRNAGGPFVIYDPGIGITGSLKIEESGGGGRAVHVSGSMSIMPKHHVGGGFSAAYRHMLEIAQKDQYLETLPGGLVIHGANGRNLVGDGYGAMGVYSGSASSPREFVISSGIGGSYSSHSVTSDINFVTSGTDNETQRAKISQYPALQVTGSFQNNGNASVTGSLSVSGAVSIQDHVFAQLTIPGTTIQTTNDAFTFNCPYNLTVEGLDIYLSTDCGGAGSVAVTVSGLTTAGASSEDIVSATITGNNVFNANSTTITNGDRDADSRITFRITTADADARDLRANLQFRRRL